MTQEEPRTRPYRKRKRARAEEETRHRITEAAVELHGTVGPANTTVTELAHLAGVSRMTVYNHFPTDSELFAACSAHWVERNPFPDPGPWNEIEPPDERLRLALGELYRWYEAKQGMLGNVLRDAPVVPGLAAVMGRLWSDYEDEVVAVLARGWKHGGVSGGELSAMLRLISSFQTWRSLVDSGLDAERAADLAARMVIRTIDCADVGTG